MRATICLLLIALAGCSGKKDDDPPAKENKNAPSRLSENVVKVNVGEFWLTYGDNPIKADSLWKGKTLQITSNVDTIKPDSIGFLKNPGGGEVSPKRYASMTEREKRFFNGQANPGIVCEIDPEYKKGFEGVEKDKPFTLIGRCEGRHDDPDVVEGFAIKLTMCQPFRVK